MSLKITFQKQSAQKVVCLGVYEGNKLPSVTAAWDKNLKGFISKYLSSTSKFKGKISQSFPLFTPDHQCFILIGLGKKEEQSKNQWQKIGGALSNILNNMTFEEEAAVEIHGLEGHKNEHVISNIAFGLLLKSWRLESYFTKKKPEELFTLKKVTFVTPSPQEDEKAFKALCPIAEGTFLTRTVVTEPSNIMTPQELANVALSLKKDGVKVEVLKEKDLKKLGMNALLCVGQGS